MRRRPYRRPRRYVCRSRIYRRRRIPLVKKVHYFKRMYNSTITLASGSDTNTNFTFALSDLANYTEFTGLYDQYKICGIKAVITPRFTETDYDKQCNTHLWSVIDYNDSGNLTSASNANEYSTCVQKPILKRHSRYFKPACQVLMNTTQATEPTAWIGMPKFNQWLPTANPDVKHYALKTFAIATGAGGNITLDVAFTYYVGCKSVK